MNSPTVGAGAGGSRWQLAVIGLLAALVLGTMLYLYVGSLSLPRCGTHAASQNITPESIRCRK